MDIKVSAFSSKKKLADILSKPLGLSREKILKSLPSDYTWMRWPKPVLEPTKERVISAMKAFHRPDTVTFTPTVERFYPYGSFAANAIGYVDRNGVGKSGLEAEYNKYLSGKNGSISYIQVINENKVGNRRSLIYQGLRRYLKQL